MAIVGSELGSQIAPTDYIDSWRVDLPVSQNDGGLPIAKPKPVNQYSSWRRVVDAYRQGLIDYATAYNALVNQFGYEGKEAEEALANPSVESTELDIPLDPGLQEAVDSGTETPQGMPNGSPASDTLPGPMEEDRTQAQGRAWRESDWAMILLGGITIYYVGRTVQKSI